MTDTQQSEEADQGKSVAQIIRQESTEESEQPLSRVATGELDPRELSFEEFVGPVRDAGGDVCLVRYLEGGGLGYYTWHHLQDEFTGVYGSESNFQVFMYPQADLHSAINRGAPPVPVKRENTPFLPIGEERAMAADGGVTPSDSPEYTVTKGGKTVDDCFIIFPQSDPIAQHALLVYAQNITDESLRADLIDWVASLDGKTDQIEAAREANADIDQESYSEDEEKEGLYNKYTVKQNGEPVEGCFVLRPETDNAAREAIAEFVTKAVEQGEMEVAHRVREWINNSSGGTVSTR
jgi:hypothetical protein